MVQHPVTLNYAVTCGCFDLSGIEPKILLINYQENLNSPVQIRLPGGRFHVQDLIDSVELFLSNNGRNKSLEFLLIDIDILNKNYLSSIEKVTEQAKINFHFNNFTLKLLLRLQNCELEETQFMEILKITHFNTLFHELREESSARGNIEDFYISSCEEKTQGHYNISFTSSCVDAPNKYDGSPDDKVLLSYWKVLDLNTIKSIFNGHKLRVQEGIRQILRLRIHPNFKILEQFNSANN